MKSMGRYAFSMAEMLVTLSLVGILCSTTLVVNGMADNKCKIAETKLAKADIALRSWQKDIMKSNENGSGVVQIVNNQNALVSSLNDYFDVVLVQESDPDEIFPSGTNLPLKNYTKIKLKDNSVLNIKFIALNPRANLYISNLAYITVEIPINNTESVSEVYILRAYKLVDMGKINGVCSGRGAI